MSINTDVIPDVMRRRILAAGIAASALFLPTPFARVWAQSDGTVKLLRVPKIALVLGNSRYKDAPLKNPANDAAAIAEALKAVGFEVTAKLDADKAGMEMAVRSYVQALAARQCVGLFYYAGHGVQLAWRNYMLPVDADIDTIGDIPKQCVEVNGLLEGLNKASNPLNVIILDACRDNPFGYLKGVDQKGLSQMDAPNNTILAYATAPGNVASDGAGANGLYTENLLREMKVPDAKIEDVFKRVRLGVRRKSEGQQIPWESTSLEDDFYFRPPAQLTKLSENEKKRLFEEELVVWERIKASTTPGPLEDYLRRYPSGEFCELAQFQLDRVLAKLGEKKVEVVSSAANPFSKGSATANTNYKVGDSYTYSLMDYYSKSEIRRQTQTITSITDSEILYDDGFVTDLLGNSLFSRGTGTRFSSNQELPLEYVVGKQWTSKYNGLSSRNGLITTEVELRIVARERIVVPAGTFNAYRIRITGSSHSPSNSARVETTIWMSPGDVRRPVIRESLLSTPRGPIA